MSARIISFAPERQRRAHVQHVIESTLARHGVHASASTLRQCVRIGTRRARYMPMRTAIDDALDWLAGRSRPTPPSAA